MKGGASRAAAVIVQGTNLTTEPHVLGGSVFAPIIRNDDLIGEGGAFSVAPFAKVAAATKRYCSD
jgi:hypothetical protein